MAKKETLYYLQNLSAGFVGNSPIFWKLGGNGYTQWIDEAEQFTTEQADAIIRGTRGSHRWKKWRVSLIQRRAKRTVDMQDIAAPKRETLTI